MVSGHQRESGCASLLRQIVDRASPAYPEDRSVSIKSDKLYLRKA
jgi:hypothetical protein